MPKTKTKKTKLPEDFRYLMWGYEFEKIDPEKMRDRIIVNTLNYGNWEQWKRLAKMYGFDNLRRFVSNIPESEFHKPSISLIKLIFHINNFKYASRSAKIRAERNIAPN